MAHYKICGSALTSDNIQLWASRLVGFSSQYDAEGWAADMALGEPQVHPEYGDMEGAWAQNVCDSNQYIEVGFDEMLYIEKINIYETYHGGSIRRVQARAQGDKWTTIWETTGLSCITSARIFSPAFNKLNFKADEVRLETDCSFSGSWCEIDAVQIVGSRYSFKMPVLMSTLADDLSNLVNNSLFSDVKFLVEKTEFYGHRAILSVRSEFFKSMFSDHQWDDNSMEPFRFPDIRSDSFGIMLHYIYTNITPQSCENCTCLQLVDVWRVAGRFGLNGLRDLAIFEITTKLKEENVVDVFIEATTKDPEITDLKTVCLEFMKNNTSEVVRTSSFKKLPQDIMVELIQIMTSKVSVK